MLKIRSLIGLMLLVLPINGFDALAASPNPRIVIYDNRATEVIAPPATMPVESNDLWVTLKDLTRATQFVLKPQGVCRQQLCFPIPKARKAAFLSKQGATNWFNLSEFARLLRQPAASDSEAATWYFGPRPEDQNGFVTSMIAPNFTLLDRNGKPHSLSDFHGKKVLLLTWASW